MDFTKHARGISPCQYSALKDFSVTWFRILYRFIYAKKKIFKASVDLEDVDLG